jgi:hypothetical protein
MASDLLAVEPFAADHGYRQLRIEGSLSEIPHLEHLRACDVVKTGIGGQLDTTRLQPKRCPHIEDLDLSTGFETLGELHRSDLGG